MQALHFSYTLGTVVAPLLAMQAFHITQCHTRYTHTDLFCCCTKRRHPKFYTEIIDSATLVLVDEHLEVTGMVTAILVNGAAQGDMMCFH